jgi:sulfur-oxidizing protein SoxA
VSPQANKPMLNQGEAMSSPWDSRALIAILIGLLAGSKPVLSQPYDLSAYVSGERRSGYTFLTPETRALQNDEFANPGMLWVEQGSDLWKTSAGRANRSCMTCHDDAQLTMRGVAAQYPSFDSRSRRAINLEQRINQCRTERQEAEPFAYESRELLAITAFVANQSRGMPVAVVTQGVAAESSSRGRAMFNTRIGQLDLACSNCHEDRVGSRLRGEPISQGQINGFPVYRQLWQTLGSTHRMFAWCNEAVRAEPFELGSQEYVDLELFVKSRANGLPVETPAVRR